MASQQLVISSIKFNTTFVHKIHTVAFDNLSNEACMRIYKDGRVFSHVIEEWLEKNYPSLKHVTGCGIEFYR